MYTDESSTFLHKFFFTVDCAHYLPTQTSALLFFISSFSSFFFFFLITIHIFTPFRTIFLLLFIIIIIVIYRIKFFFFFLLSNIRCCLKIYRFLRGMILTMYTYIFIKIVKKNLFVCRNEFFRYKDAIAQIVLHARLGMNR